MPYSVLLISLFLLVTPFITQQPSSAHSRDALFPGPIRVDNEMFSRDSLTEGQTLNITGEIVNISEGTVTITSFGIFDDTGETENNWEIINVHPQRMSLEPNDSQGFEMEIKALRQGIYHLHPSFQMLGHEERLGIGQLVTIFGDRTSSYQLHVNDIIFDLPYMLDKPYALERIWVDKERMAMYSEISGNNAKSDGKLTIWIPIDLINNKGEGQDYVASRTLNIKINGDEGDYRMPISGEEYDVYVINIPQSTSSIIEMNGSYVIPEFSLVFISLIVGFLIVVYIGRIKLLSI